MTLRRTLLCMAVGCLAVTSAWADAIDDAAKLPAPEALPKLETLLEAALDAKDAQDALRIRRHLGRIYRASGQPYAALAHLEAAMDAGLDKRHGMDRLHYAEALLATAKKNIRGDGFGRTVHPFLRDAIAVAKGGGVGVVGEPTPPAVTVRKHLVAAEAHYLLSEFEQAAAAWERARKAAGTPAPALFDLLARIRHAQKRYPEAAAAFAQAGNDLGAAAAWDAAREPDKSVPIYARRIAAEPANRALLDQALRGARFTGAHGQLFDALANVETPKGTAGIELLLMRADLLEAAGRAADAVPLLEDARTRSETDVRPSLRLARLLILAGDAEDEAVWDQAATAYIEAIDREPENTAAAEGLAWIASRDYGRLWSTWRDERVTSRCVRVQEALVKAMPDDALALMNLGNTMRVLGRTKEALAYYDRAVEANPYDPAVRSDRGLALSAARRDKEALGAFARSLELDGGHLAGRQNAARALWLQGDDDTAEAHLGAAVATARAIGRSAGTYRFLLDRIWRTRHDPRLR